MSQLVFFLEERSAKALLEAIMPRLFPDGFEARYVVFEGKQDLEKQLMARLRGYLVPHARFIVLRDQDSADCHEVKKVLRQICVDAGRPEAVVRIACRELESWYLADLAAVETALGVKGLGKQQNTSRYKFPDLQQNPARLLKDIAPAYQKISGSRAIGPHMNLENSRSASFAHFIAAIRKVAAIR
jgi:hypothetical protein